MDVEVRRMLSYFYDGPEVKVIGIPPRCKDAIIFRAGYSFKRIFIWREIVMGSIMMQKSVYFVRFKEV